MLITGTTTVISQISSLASGTYTLRYNATDSSGVVGYATRSLTISNQISAYDLNNGYMYIQRSYNLSGDLTLECYVYLTRMHTDSFGIIDTRSPLNTNVNDVGCVVWFLEPPNGSMRFYDPASRLAPDFTTNSISVGVWTHIAWVRTGGTWVAYSNGIKGSGTSSTPTTLKNPTLWLVLGADVGNIRDGSTRYKFEGKLSQVKISSRAVYSSNFTPAQDLTPSPSDSSVLFFLGANGIDTVSGITLTQGGTVLNTSRTISITF